MLNRSTAIINQKALLHNIATVRLHAPNSKVLAMVKANAYGHGIQDVAKLIPADAYGVANLTEALALYDCSVNKPILLMSGVINTEELELAIKYNFHSVIHHPSQIKLLKKIPANKKLNIWLKYDSGMNRLGLNDEQLIESLNILKQDSRFNIQTLMTHLAKADSDTSFSQQQIQKFTKLTQDFNLPKSICNSAGIMQYKDAHYDWVRPGIMLYGVSPYADKSSKALNLKPVMTLYSTVLAVNKVSKGETVSYGGLWRAAKDSIIAVVGIGYGDGYPIHIQANTPVYLHGKCAPIVGRVAMDMLMVDITSLRNVQVGEQVEMWGENLSVEEIAKCANTIPYNLLCSVASRVSYVFK